MIQYIMSKTKDGTKWIESIYGREYDSVVKLAKIKLKEDGILAVKITRIITEDIFRLNKEEK